MDAAAIAAIAAITHRKRALRAELRARRRALPTAEVAALDEVFRRTIAGLTELARIRTLAAYVATDGELGVGPALELARDRGLAILLPRLAGANHVEFAQGAFGELARGRRSRIPEPTGAPVGLDSVELPGLILVPSVALDLAGNRLGRGGGHYDRLLRQLRTMGWTIVGVTRDCCLVDTLPVEPYDEPVDIVLTETRCFRPPGKQP